MTTSAVAGCRGANGVDDEIDPDPPAFRRVALVAQLAPPMHHHARLRHGECQERADGKQRNQAVGDAVKYGQQQSGGKREIDDADRRHQSSSEGRKRPRQELILRHDMAQTRQTDEARARGQAKDAKRAGNRHVIEDAASRHRADELRQHALVTSLSLVHGHDAVGHREVGDAGEQDAQSYDNRSERPTGVGHARLAKCVDTVADRLDAGHRRAAAGERPQQ